MRYGYLKLLAKEVRQAAGTALVFTGVIGAALLYLISRVGVWEGELVLAGVMALGGFIPFWALWRTYYSLRQEWTGDHMYLLLSFPVPGWYLTSTKLLVAFIEATVYTLLVVGSALLVFTLSGGVLMPRQVLGLPAFYGTALRLGVLFGLMLLIGMVVIQFAYLCGRLVNRFRILVSLLAAFVSTWLLLRGGTWLAPLLGWMPELTVYSILNDGEIISVMPTYIGLAPLFGSTVVAFLLFVLGSLLLERDLEL